MEYSKKSAGLIKNIALFFLASFLPRAITFFMVPLYTYCLSAEEYGAADLLITTIQLLLPVLTLQVQDAMLRFTMEKSNKPEDVLTVGLRIAAAGSVILSFVCIAGKLLNIIALDWVYILMFVIIYLTNAIKNIASYFCRGIDKVGVLTASNVALTFATVLCNILFLLVFKWSIYGYLLAMCIGNLLGVFILFFGARLHKFIKLTVADKSLTKHIIRFSIPMVFSALAWWINNSLDKYILGYFWNAAAVGLLAVAYKIPSVLSLMGTAIANAYSISAIKDFDKDDTDGFLGRSYSAINICFAVICSALMIVNVFVSRLLFSKEFFAAWQYVPPLLVSALFSQLSLTCEQYYIALKKTKIISATAVGGAAINFLANILLIPYFGAYGAAAATAFGFFIVWLVRYCILTKYLKLKHNFIKECIIYVLIIVQLCFAYFGNRFIIFQLIILLCILVLYFKDIVKMLGAFARQIARRNARG